MTDEIEINGSTGEDLLEAHAANWSNNGPYTTEELDWIYVPALPCNLFWTSKAEARAWWRDENRQARKYGAGGMWDCLLEEPIENPVVIGIYGADDFDIWDGNHRMAACTINGVGSVPAVVGILKGLDRQDLPEKVRDMLGAILDARGPRPAAP